MRFRILPLIAVMLMAAAPLLAQGVGTTSSLSGIVTTGGKPLPGVTVTIASPALQGTRTSVTGEGGGYNFPSLPPGQYTVTFELEGMQRLTRKVSLELATSQHLDAAMRLASVAEAITVTAAAPAVLETTEVSRNFDQKKIQQLPVRRNVRDTVLLAPGVNANGPNQQIMISGGPSYDNLFLINGVVVNENLRGQPHNLFIEDAIQETTTLTGGISAEYGRFTGGVVSAITKSGGNQFSGSLRDSITDPKWIATTAYPGGEPAHPNVRSNVYEATLGGYALKDRLWFFAAGRHTKGAPANGFNAQVTGVSGTNGKSSGITFRGLSFLNTDDEDRYEAKLTGNITQKHTLVASYLNVKFIENNNFFPPIYDQASIVTQRSLPNSLKALAYNGILTSNALIEAQISQKKFAFVHSGGLFNDQIRGTWIADSSARFNAPVFCGNCTNEERNNDLGSVKGHYFLNTKSLGNHDFVVGGELYKETRLVNNNQSASNFEVFSTGTANFLPGDPTPYAHFIPNSTAIAYRPILLNSTGDHFNTTGIFVNDKWDLNSRVNLNVGVRYDKNNAHDATGNLVSDDHAFSPRLAALWDIEGNGHDRVNLSYAKYVSKITDGNAGGAGNAAGTPALFEWFYNGPAINPVDSNGVIIGTPLAPQDALKQLFDWFNNQNCDSQGRCGINAVGTLIASSYPGFTQRILNPIKSPSVNEISAGYGRQFGTSGYARVDLIKRDWHDFYGLMVNSTTGQITAPNGTVNDLAVLVNDNRSIKRYYRAAQMNFAWNAMRRINIGGGYTFSTLRGNDTDEADGTATSPITGSDIFYPEYTNYAQRQPMGFLSGDVKHRGRVWASYDMPTRFGNFNWSLIQSADSGRAYSAIGTVDPTGTTTNFKFAGAPTKPSYYVGTPANPNVPSQLNTAQNYFFSKRGQFRTPSVFSTDLALNYEIPVSRATIFIQGQAINIFNESKVNNLVGGQFNTTVLTTRSNGSASTGLSPFNPFTGTPIECPQGASAATCKGLGANWQKGPLFGTGLSKDAYQTPRTYRLSAGVRF